MANKQNNEGSEFELINQAQEDLLNVFINSLQNKDEKLLKSREQYRQVINALNVDDAFKSSVTKNFMELLLKLLATENVTEIQKINGIIDALKGDVNKYDWNGKKSYKTYLNRFIRFLKEYIKDKNKRSEYKSNYKSLKMDPAANAALANTDGELYLNNILFTKFKSRLRCQDRTSGQKIWLPLRFIAKLYNKNVNVNADSSFSEWLDSLVNDICIHYKEDKSFVHLKFGDKNDLSLLLKKSTNTDDKYEVYVRWYENEDLVEHLVYTPTGRGNEKVPMEVEKISDIAIDHVKPIDQTLKEMAGNLKELEKVSDYYKKLIEEQKDPTNAEAKSLINKENIDLNELIEDLKKIKSDSPLRVMSSEYNSNKSNGNTFQRIIKDVSGNYFGILLEGIKDENEESSILYQNLKENGVMRIRTDKIEGDEVKSNNYIKIIDLI